MNILFICGSAEPGKDGVGDYTRRLSSELIKAGHFVKIVALCDKKVTTFTNQNQEVEQTKVTVYRIPILSSNRQRLIWSREIINNVQPDWISLQFVPYSFNPKGLPFWLPSFLNKLKGNHKWHIMFHELWVGREDEVELKQKMLSYMQQMLLKWMNSKLKPKVIHTHLPIYQVKLKTIDIQAKPLSLFSNIKVSKTVSKKNETVFKIAFFSQAELSKPLIDFVNEMCLQAKEQGLECELVFIGGNAHKMKLLSEAYRSACPLLKKSSYTGFLSELEISEMIASCHLGLTPIPQHALGKSGSVAAFLAHGVPVGAPVVFTINNYNSNIGFFKQQVNNLVIPKPFWSEYLIAKELSKKYKNAFNLSVITELFLEDLQNIKVNLYKIKKDE